MRELLRSFEGLEVISDDLLRIPLSTPTLPPASCTNHYLVGGSTALLVDPSAPSRRDQRRLVALIQRLENEHGWRFVALFATHHHNDHVGAAGALGRALGLPLWGHAQTAERVAAGIRFDRLIEDEEIVAGGEGSPSWRALHTPGHAPGHLILASEAGGVIAGDMVAGTGTIVIDPLQGRMSEYLQSLARMEALRPHFLAPAHGPVLYEAQRVLRELREHRLAREARVLAALESTWCSDDALLPRVYADTPRVRWPLALRSLRAHLLHLEEQGEIERWGERWRRLG